MAATEPHAQALESIIQNRPGLYRRQLRKYITVFPITFDGSFNWDKLASAALEEWQNLDEIAAYELENGFFMRREFFSPEYAGSHLIAHLRGFQKTGSQLQKRWVEGWIAWALRLSGPTVLRYALEPGGRTGTVKDYGFQMQIYGIGDRSSLASAKLNEATPIMLSLLGKPHSYSSRTRRWRAFRESFPPGQFSPLPVAPRIFEGYDLSTWSNDAGLVRGFISRPSNGNGPSRLYVERSGLSMDSGRRRNDPQHNRARLEWRAQGGGGGRDQFVLHRDPQIRIERPNLGPPTQRPGIASAR